MSKKYDVPVSITLHGHSLLHAPQHGPGVTHKIERALQEADRLIVSGPWMQQVATSAPWNCPPDQVRIISYGVERSLCLDRPDPELEARYRERRVLVCGGYLIDRKCQDLIIDAVAKLRPRFPTLHLVLVGDGPNRDRLEQQARRLGIEEAVEITGMLAQREVFRYYSIAEAMVLPSYDEAFGLAYPEAWAHEKPVVACEGEGISKYIIENDCGLLVPRRDGQAVARAIEQLLENPEQARAMGRRGRCVVDREFSWTRNGEKSLELFEELIRQRRACQ